MKRGLLLLFVLLLPIVSAAGVEKAGIQDNKLVITIQGKVTSQIEFFKEGLSRGTYKLCAEDRCDFKTRKDFNINLSSTGINEIGDYVLRIEEIVDNEAAVQSYPLTVNRENLDACTDSTLEGACSTNRPLFCEKGQLVERCGRGTFSYYTNNLDLETSTMHTRENCGDCPAGKTCQTDGSCKEPVKEETTIPSGAETTKPEEVEQGCKTSNPSDCASYTVKGECNSCGLCIWTKENNNPEKCYAKCDSLNPQTCDSYERFACNRCDLCNWNSNHCCPKGMNWDRTKNTCTAETPSTNPNCADYDFNKDWNVGFSDSTALSEQKIDYNKDGKYSWIDKILFLWDINLFGSGGCVWSDNDLLTKAISLADYDVCDDIQDSGKKNYCYQVSIAGSLFGKNKKDAAELQSVCDDKLSGYNAAVCKRRTGVFNRTLSVNSRIGFKFKFENTYGGGQSWPRNWYYLWDNVVVRSSISPYGLCIPYPYYKSEAVRNSGPYVYVSCDIQDMGALSEEKSFEGPPYNRILTDIAYYGDAIFFTYYTEDPGNDYIEMRKKGEWSKPSYIKFSGLPFTSAYVKFTNVEPDSDGNLYLGIGNLYSDPGMKQWGRLIKINTRTYPSGSTITLHTNDYRIFGSKMPFNIIDIAASGSNVLALTTDKIYVFDKEGNLKNEYLHGLSDLKGIGSDKDDSIYVGHGNKISVFSSDFSSNIGELDIDNEGYHGYMKHFVVSEDSVYVLLLHPESSEYADDGSIEVLVFSKELTISEPVLSAATEKICTDKDIKGRKVVLVNSYEGNGLRIGICEVKEFGDMFRSGTGSSQYSDSKTNIGNICNEAEGVRICNAGESNVFGIHSLGYEREGYESGYFLNEIGIRTSKNGLQDASQIMDINQKWNVGYGIGMVCCKDAGTVS